MSPCHADLFKYVSDCFSRRGEAPLRIGIALLYPLSTVYALAKLATGVSADYLPARSRFVCHNSYHMRKTTFAKSITARYTHDDRLADTYTLSRHTRQSSVSKNHSANRHSGHTARRAHVSTLVYRVPPAACSTVVMTPVAATAAPRRGSARRQLHG